MLKVRNTPLQGSQPKTLGAFTLLELLIVIALLGILSAIAFPAYDSYILRGKIRGAQADLMALALNLENRFQGQLSYGTDSKENTAALQEEFSGWSPARSADFDYSLTRTGSEYRLQAQGKNGKLIGCTLRLNSRNQGTLDSCPGVQTW